MQKNIIKLIAIGFLFLISCKEESPVIEKVSLDDIRKVTVNIYYGDVKQGDTKFTSAPQPSKSTFLVKNVILLERDNNGKWSYSTSSNNNRFNLEEGNPVVLFATNSSEKVSTKRFGFDFTYSDADGNSLNKYFADQKDVFQTLFSINSYIENNASGKPLGNKVDVQTKDILDYTYRDLLPYGVDFNHYTAGVSNQGIGFTGYTSIKKSQISFDLTVDVVKFSNAKSKNKNSAFLEDANINDIAESVKFTIPMNVITTADGLIEETLFVEQAAAYYDMDIGDFSKFYFGFDPMTFTTYPAYELNYNM